MKWIFNSVFKIFFNKNFEMQTKQKMKMHVGATHKKIWKKDND